MLAGSLFALVDETEVVDDEAVLAVLSVGVLESSDCCCIYINIPMIMLERLTVVLPTRPPSLAGVKVVDWLELELELAELVDEAEVGSSRDRRLISSGFVLLDEPIPAMDMVGSPFLCTRPSGRAIQQKHSSCQNQPKETAECGVIQLSLVQLGDKGGICCRTGHKLPVQTCPVSMTTGSKRPDFLTMRVSAWYRLLQLPLGRRRVHEFGDFSGLRQLHEGVVSGLRQSVRR